MQKKFFCGFSPSKMHCEFTYTANAFQDESWDLLNFICYEGSLSYTKVTGYKAYSVKILELIVYSKISNRI